MKLEMFNVQPHSFLAYCDALDKSGQSYSLVRKRDTWWELWIDGCDNCAHIYLNSDGTWGARLPVFISNEDES